MVHKGSKEQHAYSDTSYVRKTATLDSHPKVQGYNFEQNFSLQDFIQAYATTGFQATNLALGIEVTNQMIEEKDCLKILSFSGNMISSGLRDIITFLVKHKYIDAIVTSAAGIEEDLIKCHKHFCIGTFDASGQALFDNGVGRIGNIFVPFDRYLYFEEFMNKEFQTLYKKQTAQKRAVTPTQITAHLGQAIDNEESFLYWAAQNNIPVFCPGIIDGALGDLAYFFSKRQKDFQIDLIGDQEKMIDMTINANKTGAVILGGGIAKHYTLNSNIFRDGLDYAVYITTASGHDGSDSGGNQEEAKTWAKIKVHAPQVKITAEASIVFPLLVAATFAQKQTQAKSKKGAKKKTKKKK